MEKLDLTKTDKKYFSAKNKPEILELGKTQYLSILGKGDPSGSDYASRIQALYATAYVLKFLFKSRKNDFVVSKLEALWWFDEDKFAIVSMDEAPQKIPRSEWEYRLLIRVPDFVSLVDIDQAKDSVLRNKSFDHVTELSFYEMDEGSVVQMMHLGPFANEPETLRVIRDFMMERNLEKNGSHHEVYLSDYKKTAPEKLRTILREPFKYAR